LLKGVWVCAYACACAYACVHVCMCVCVSKCVCVSTCPHTCSACAFSKKIGCVCLTVLLTLGLLRQHTSSLWLSIIVSCCVHLSFCFARLYLCIYMLLCDLLVNITKSIHCCLNGRAVIVHSIVHNDKQPHCNTHVISGSTNVQKGGPHVFTTPCDEDGRGAQTLTRTGYWEEVTLPLHFIVRP